MTLLCVLATGGVIASCDSSLTKPALYNQVEVSTVQRDGQPVPGVGLELYIGARPMGYGRSDASGSYTFERVPNGEYGVFLTELPDGYALPEQIFGGRPTNFVDGLVIARDTTVKLRFTLLKPTPGTLAVHVADVAGPALVGVPMTLYTGDRTISHTTTDASGNARFTDVPFGQYGVVVTRPILYRDYKAAGDSLYSYHDRLPVEGDVVDSVTFKFQRCAGTVRARVLDAAGAPVRNATVSVYTSTEHVGDGATGSDGLVLLNGPCVRAIGVYVTPPTGYTVAAGRGASFFDGITVARDRTVDVVFRLHRQP